MNKWENKSVLELQREIDVLKTQVNNYENWIDLAKNLIDQVQDLIFEIKESTTDW